MFKQVFFINSLALAGMIFAMDAPQKRGKWSIDVDAQQVQYYVGPPLCYYGEYRAKQLSNGIVSFPIERTDPLPVEYFGDIRYFVTSAKTGALRNEPYSNPGTAFKILDPSITNMVVVRGASDANSPLVGFPAALSRIHRNSAQVYLGFNINDFKSGRNNRKDRFYQGRIMVIDTKLHAEQGFGDWHQTPFVDQNALSYLSSMDITQELRKYLSSEDLNWKSPVFQAMVKKLLGDRSKDFIFSNQDFYCPEVYWTAGENKLKKIKYHSAK